MVLIFEKVTALRQLDDVGVQYLRDGGVGLVQGQAQLWGGEVVHVGILRSLQISYFLLPTRYIFFYTKVNLYLFIILLIFSLFQQHNCSSRDAVAG